MSDDPTSLKKQVRDIFKALNEQAPGAIKMIGDTLKDTAGSQLEAERAVSPGYQELYKQGELASAGTEADVVEGPGARLVSAADKYQRELDPEAYASRAAVGDAINKYLSSYSPTELSPTEVAQISRGINATTGPVTPSNMNTIRNAQTFGDKATQRWQNFGNAVSQAAATLPNLKSGLTGFDIARTRGSDTGARAATTNSLAPNYGFATSALGDITGTNQQRQSQIKDLWDTIYIANKSFESGTGGLKNIGV